MISFVLSCAAPLDNKAGRRRVYLGDWIDVPVFRLDERVAFPPPDLARQYSSQPYYGEVAAVDDLERDAIVELPLTLERLEHLHVVAE